MIAIHYLWVLFTNIMTFIFEMFGIEHFHNKKEIIQLLKKKYSVDDLGDSIFVKRIGLFETYCMEFIGTSLCRIRRTRNMNNEKIDIMLYEAEHEELDGEFDGIEDESIDMPNDEFPDIDEDVIPDIEDIAVPDGELPEIAQDDFSDLKDARLPHSEKWD